MKRMMAVITGIGMVMVFFISSATAGQVGKRQVIQDKRIAQGVASGELTRGEARALILEQKRIQAAKQRAWADGKLTYRERMMLDKMQDQANRHIYRLKHNRKTY